MWINVSNKVNKIFFASMLLFGQSLKCPMFEPFERTPFRIDPTIPYDTDITNATIAAERQALAKSKQENTTKPEDQDNQKDEKDINPLEVWLDFIKDSFASKLWQRDSWGSYYVNLMYKNRGIVREEPFSLGFRQEVKHFNMLEYPENHRYEELEEHRAAFNYLVACMVKNKCKFENVDYFETKYFRVDAGRHGFYKCEATIDEATEYRSAQNRFLCSSD